MNERMTARNPPRVFERPCCIENLRNGSPTSQARDCDTRASRFSCIRLSFLVSSYAERVARNLAGDMPVNCLKVFEKWLWSEKPAARAMSTSGASDVEISLHAYS